MQKIVLMIAISAGICLAAVQPLEQEVLKDYMSSGAPFDFILIDVRSQGETMSVIGDENCKPYNLAWPEQFKNEIVRIPKDQAIVVYCRSGSRSSSAAAYLNNEGYTRVYDAGGISTWRGPRIGAPDIKPLALLPEPSMRAKPESPQAAADGGE